MIPDTLQERLWLMQGRAALATPSPQCLQSWVALDPVKGPLWLEWAPCRRGPHPTRAAPHGLWDPSEPREGPSLLQTGEWKSALVLGVRPGLTKRTPCLSQLLEGGRQGNTASRTWFGAGGHPATQLTLRPS